MLRIATVEDDANDLEALRTHLSRYEKENGLKFQVTEFRDGEDIVTDYSADYDLPAITLLFWILRWRS